MKRLAVTVLMSMLVSACGSTAGHPPATLTPSQSASATAVIVYEPDSADQPGVCQYYNNQYSPAIALSLTPAAPRAGDTVRVTKAESVTAVTSGSYGIAIAYPRAGPERFQDVVRFPATIVGSDGQFGSFTWPSAGLSGKCVIVYAGDRQHGAYLAQPFVAP